MHSPCMEWPLAIGGKTPFFEKCIKKKSKGAFKGKKTSILKLFP